VLSAVPAGRYVLRSSAAFERPTSHDYSLEVTSRVSRPVWWLVLAVLLFLWPLVTALRASHFESTRWAESNVASESSEEDDE
jgi:hypothetical protein